MKKPKNVIEAEAALTSKAEELTAAKGALKILEAEYGAAYAAVRQAQTEADAALPQCRMVRARWRSGADTDMGRVVILRRTPSGMLVVRNVGEPNGGAYKFKWNEYSAKYRQAEKISGYFDTACELRDVPAEYLPTKRFNAESNGGASHPTRTPGYRAG